MKVRLFKKDEDYNTVRSWYEDRKHEPAPVDYLSDYGVIVNDNEKDICAIWLYPVLSAKFAIVMAPVSNPDSTKEQRDIGLNMCMDTIQNIAKDLGYNLLMCWSNVEPFEKRLKSLGYVPGDKNCTHYWGGL